MYVLVQYWNEYDQHGAYFIACWAKKPLISELVNIFNGDHKLALNVYTKCGSVSVKNYVKYEFMEIKEGEVPSFVEF